jgi:hypothetical protein
MIEPSNGALGRGLRSRMLEIMHQDNAFAMLLQLGHQGMSDLLGLAHLEVEGIEVGGEKYQYCACRDTRSVSAVAAVRESGNMG